ncbi:MAG TPA: phospholipase D family protein [Burkholderiaceae bacterium]|nr:phospholipase D family protein [Burkholderiaceae bacterium]
MNNVFISMVFRPFSRRVCVTLLAMWLVFLTSGCATAPEMRRPVAEQAQAPRADSHFEPVETQITGQFGPAHSGFHLLERSDQALLWRLALIDSAKHSIDLQYYVWFGDTLGHLMMSRVVQAAHRGVKVRILFDDLNTMLRDMTHVEMRDQLLRHIAKHPNIQIRVFNPWHDRSFIGRGLGMISDFQRLNRRMHNKQMVVDNRASIIGGRNLGDEYFGLNPDFNFHDLDVLGVGPVARQASQVFDRYWNSEWVEDIPKSVTDNANPEELRAEMLSLLHNIENPSLRAIRADRTNWTPAISELNTLLLPGQSVVHTDSPSRSAVTKNHMPDAIRALMRSAKSELLITNAYIIPDANFMADLRDLGQRGVKVRILTNSLASHDVPAVNSHYEKWREPILATGAQLFELRPDAKMRRELAEIAPLQAEFVGLHAKAMVIDRQRSFVGSMNLDPRSEILNSEMGIIIDSATLSEKLAERMLQDMNGLNSWQVLQTAPGQLTWRSQAGELTQQPARNLMQRLENFIFKLFPKDLY